MMRAARLYGVGDIRLTDEPAPVPAQDETLVRITSVGLCGSDLHWYTEGGIGDAVLKEPLAVGHEFAGVTSDGVRVAIDPAIPCENCASCLSGWGNLCPSVRFAGHGSLDGALRQVIAWPTRLLHPLPDALSDDEGAMLEPLGVALHAFDLGHVHLGARVAVIGCGPIGLLLVQLAVRSGASAVMACDPILHRLEAARAHGATTDAIEADVVFEVAGTDAAVHTALATARPGARVVLVGIPEEDSTTFQASLARRKGLTLAMSRRMHNTYPRAISLVSEGHIDLKSLVTSRYPLAHAAEAFTTAAARTGLKVVIDLT